MNMTGMTKDSYENGKLKKFLTMIKLMMQDALFNLTYNSCYKFIDTLTTFVPAETVVEGPVTVNNTFTLTAE
jgi:dynein heavy chain